MNPRGGAPDRSRLHCFRRSARCLLSLSFALSACAVPVVPAPQRRGESRWLYYGESQVAQVEEQWSVLGPMWRLQRTSSSQILPDTITELEVWLGPEGSVHQAMWRRLGPTQTRVVQLEARGGDVQWHEHGTLRGRIFVDRPIVLPETLHAWKAEIPTSLTAIDLSSGESLALDWKANGLAGIFYDEAGAVFAEIGDTQTQLGPGLFWEHSAMSPQARHSFAAFSDRDSTQMAPMPAALAISWPRSTLAGRWWLAGIQAKWPNLALDGPGQQRIAEAGRVGVWLDAEHVDLMAPLAQDYMPSVGIESDHEGVERFAAEGFSSPARPSHAFRDAWEIAKRIHSRMSWSNRGGPPSALSTLATFDGDCDNATALLVAALRARGHAARSVVGYRVWEGTLSPHAWAEVYTPSGWQSVDPSIPARGPLLTHLRLFEGLGSPLSIGRVLGRLQLVEIVPQP